MYVYRLIYEDLSNLGGPMGTEYAKNTIEVFIKNLRKQKKLLKKNLKK